MPAPGAFSGACLLSAGLLLWAAPTERPTETPTKNAWRNAPDFPALPPDAITPRRSAGPLLLRSAGPDPGRLPHPSPGGRHPVRAGPHRPAVELEKIPAKNFLEGFTRTVRGLLPGIFTPPYSPPTAGKNLLEILEAVAPRKFPLSPFSPKIARKFWAKIIPQSPLKGDVWNGFGGIDGGAAIGYHAGQAQAARPRPSEPPPPAASRKGR